MPMHRQAHPAPSRLERLQSHGNRGLFWGSRVGTAHWPLQALEGGNAVWCAQPELLPGGNVDFSQPRFAPAFCMGAPQMGHGISSGVGMEPCWDRGPGGASLAENRLTVLSRGTRQYLSALSFCVMVLPTGCCAVLADHNHRRTYQCGWRYLLETTTAQPRGMWS